MKWRMSRQRQQKEDKERKTTTRKQQHQKKSCRFWPYCGAETGGLPPHSNIIKDNYRKTKTTATNNNNTKILHADFGPIVQRKRAAYALTVIS